MCLLLFTPLYLLDYARRAAGRFVMQLQSLYMTQEYEIATNWVKCGMLYILLPRKTFFTWLNLINPYRKLFSKRRGTFILSRMTCQVTLLCNLQSPLDYIVCRLLPLKVCRLLAEDFSGRTSHTQTETNTHTHTVFLPHSADGGSALSNTQAWNNIGGLLSTDRQHGNATETAM